MNYIAQIFGFIAIGSSLVIYQQKKRRNILIFKSVQDICWFAHYMILSAYSAAATSAICFIRAQIYNSDRPIFKKKIWILVFLIFYAVSAAFTWNGIFSLFPALSSSLSSIAFWLKNVNHTKILSIVASLSTLVYNVNVSNSVAVYVGVTFTITSALSSLIIAYIKKRRANTDILQKRK